MKTKKLKKACQNIFYLFDTMEEYGVSPDIPLTQFFAEISTKTKEYRFIKKIVEKVQDRLPRNGEKKWAIDIFDGDIWADLTHTSFGIGFVLGQMFDPTSPSLQKDIETIKKVLKKNVVLPYLPKERKAA